MGDPGSSTSPMIHYLYKVEQFQRERMREPTLEYPITQFEHSEVRDSCSEILSSLFDGETAESGSPIA